MESATRENRLDSSPQTSVAKQKDPTLALSQYRKVLFQNIALWELSKDDLEAYTLQGNTIAKQLCNDQIGLSELDAYQGWLELEYERFVYELFGFSFTSPQEISDKHRPSEELAQKIQPALRNLFEQETGTLILVELYEQFGLMPVEKKQADKGIQAEPTCYSALLRDALRLLLGVQLQQAEKKLKTEIRDRLRYHLFKEMLARTKQCDHKHADTCKKWLQNSTSISLKGIPVERQSS